VVARCKAFKARTRTQALGTHALTGCADVPLDGHHLPPLQLVCDAVNRVHGRIKPLQHIINDARDVLASIL
jgi:hypothetical protein